MGGDLMPLIKCKHCGFVLQRPVGIRTDPRTGQKYGADTAQYVTCSRCEGRRAPREDEKVYARMGPNGLVIDSGGDYQGRVKYADDRKRHALVEFETETGKSPARVPYEQIERGRR